MTNLTIDRIISLIAFATLFAFLAILFGYVTRWDLGILVFFTIGLAGWDFWQMSGRRKNN